MVLAEDAMTKVLLATALFLQLLGVLLAQDLTGKWTADDGGAYYVRQTGNTVWWVGLSTESPGEAENFFLGLAFTNVFKGTITNRTITGEWADLPRSGTIQSGRLAIAIVSVSPTEVRLQKLPDATTGGFGASNWSRATGTSPTCDIHCRFQQVRKSGGDTLLDELKNYKDNVVLFATVNDSLALSYPANAQRDYHSFFCNSSAGDGDITFGVTVDVPSLDAQPNFWADGWRNDIQPSDFRRKLTRNGSLHSEIIMYGRTGVGGVVLPQECINGGDGTTLLPGWMQQGANSVLWNGIPINSSVTSNAGGIFVGGASLDRGTRVRLSGVFALDCGHGITHPCDDDDPSTQNQEMHPVYSVDVLQDFTKPRPGATLTGTWHANDVGTYYLRQMPDNTIWWLGLSRDRGQTFTNVFHGVIQGNTVAGEWADVPLGATRNNGTLGFSASQGALSVNLTRTAESGGFGAQTWQKLYDRLTNIPIP
jgi:hypothetical protein